MFRAYNITRKLQKNHFYLFVFINNKYIHFCSLQKLKKNLLN